MHSHASWSISLGRWGGLRVRLHVFFLLFAAFTVYLSGVSRFGAGNSDLAWRAAESLGILFVSVLLHELGHFVAAMWLGGEGNEIVIGPLGGLASMRVPSEPLAELAVHLAGPLLNLLLCSVSGLALLLTDPSNLAGLLNPLAPQDLIEGSNLLVALKLSFWINWALLLVNLLPAFPFDGGRALRAALSARRSGERSLNASFFVATLAKITAVALLVVAWLCRGNELNSLVPLWFALVLLAILLYFSAKQEEDRPAELETDEGLFGYDFSQGYTSLERGRTGPERRPGILSSWRERRREKKLRLQREREAEDERRVDEILARLHERGSQNLSVEDRALLKRVSARYRHRNSENR